MSKCRRFLASTPELDKRRLRAKKLCHNINNSLSGQNILFQDLFNSLGKNFVLWGNFFCEFGDNITIGDNVFVNTNCVMLDSFEIYIGSNTSIGPNVGIYTTNHSFDVVERRNNIEYGSPIVIGDDVWIGGNVVILPGVSIGDSCVLGAGSVITRNIPRHSIVKASLHSPPVECLSKGQVNPVQERK